MIKVCVTVLSVEFSQSSHRCDSLLGLSVGVAMFCLRGGGQMDEVITRISDHEGGAMDHCHHQANSWRQKPLQQLADYKNAHAQADALSPRELP